MRKFLTVSALTLATALAAPAAARADVFLTPYAGVNFAGSTIDKRTNIGAALTWLGLAISTVIKLAPMAILSPARRQ